MADIIDSHLLVKFDEAVEVTGGKEKKTKQAAIQILCEDSTFTSNELDEILNSTVAPEEWTSDGKYFRQTLSRDSATRLDAINLQHNLDTFLKERQARNTGICPVRRLLYGQCFDEIIRQVAVDSPERGLLLLRMRDEIRMTIATYHALYESAVAYGRTNVDMEFDIKQELMGQIKVLDMEAEISRREVETLRMDVEHTRRTLKEKREMDTKRFAEEVQFVKRANQQLNQEAESLLDFGKNDPAAH